MGTWHNTVEYLRIFARERPQVMMRDLVNYFNLDGTFTFSSEFNEGYLQVNSIKILETTPGIHKSGSFIGTYFQDIPISITAIPEEGYEFSHWEGSISNNNTNPTIEILSKIDVWLNPIFNPN